MNLSRTCSVFLQIFGIAFRRRENPSTEDQRNRLLTLSLNTKLTFALFGVLPYSEWPVEHPPSPAKKTASEEAIKSPSLIRLPPITALYPTNLIRTRERVQGGV
jgi:hypothetical protein